jgi:hypothetical protein
MPKGEPLGTIEEAALADGEGESALDRVARDRGEERLVLDRLDIDELRRPAPPVGAGIRIDLQLVVVDPQLAGELQLVQATA